MPPPNRRRRNRVSCPRIWPQRMARPGARRLRGCATGPASGVDARGLEPMGRRCALAGSSHGSVPGRYLNGRGAAPFYASRELRHLRGRGGRCVGHQRYLKNGAKSGFVRYSRGDGRPRGGKAAAAAAERSARPRANGGARGGRHRSRRAGEPIPGLGSPGEAQFRRLMGTYIQSSGPRHVGARISSS